MRNTGLATRYTLAIFAAAAALFLRNLLIPLLGNNNPYHTVWLAVVFAAWYCGLGPSIVASVIGALGVWYWFLPPSHSFAIRDRNDIYGLLGFLAFSSAIVALGEANRRGLSARLRSEERFRAIVETTPECVKVVTAEGVVLHMNSSGLKMIEAGSAEMVVGKNIYDLIASEDRDRFRAFNERICRGEKGSLKFDIVGLRGERRHMETHAAPLPNADGTVAQLAVTRDVTKRKQAEEAIKEKELSSRLLKLQDEERRRVARELHDGVGQLLVAMSMNASRLNEEKSKLSPDAARCAEENSRLIEQASADIRTMSYLFHPPLLDEMGLHSALKWYVEGFAERSKIAAELELPTDGARLPQDHELCLFRIAQECLTNIHRHSGSSTALVRLLRSPGEIKLEVSDKGKGVNQETQLKIASGETAGVGLRGMRERLRQLGGSVEIRSNGHGTIVTATVPFAESAPSIVNSSSDDGQESHDRLAKTNGDPSNATEIRPLNEKATSQAAKA
jgi:PAS domain S-box-containing protein